MNGPEVSVIIPVYNGEKTLRKCLNSILGQAYENYEVIVVDNNSSDNTKEIIREFQKNNKKIKYIFEPKKSRGAARNSGIRKAKGEIFAMTDSDCTVPENWILEITKPIIHENETAVLGFEKDLVNNYWTKNIQKASLEFTRRNLNGKYISHIDTKNFAIKSSVMKELMFDPALRNLDDLDLYLRLKKNFRIKFEPAIIVGHNHKSSFVKVVKINFDRAYWAIRIYEKHKRAGLKNEAMFESMSVKNFFFFPFWLIFQFIKRPLGEAFFLLVWETSWRVGFLWAKLNHLRVVFLLSSAS